jgi:catechol 2,3-dioxygenase-like lactoylglutathione lyase family enzyme
VDAGGAGIASGSRARHIRLNLLGYFLEIGIATADIRASVEFYERLRFTQAQTGDAWAHPYGVLTDGRLCIGLHQSRLESPALTFVRPGVAGHVAALERLGIELSRVSTGDEVFHELAFRDPAGQPVRLLEARTYSPADRAALETSRCGEFRALSLPATDLERVRHFWETLGFVAGEEEAQPYPHLSLKSDAIELALHRPRFFAEPLLVFRDGGMAARIARLRELGIGPIATPPGRLDARANALLVAPEGTALLLLQENCEPIPPP